MITELTAEQEAMFPEYVDKYIKLGLVSGGTIDQDKARAYTKRLYTVLGREQPADVLFMPGPTAAWKFIKERYNLPSDAAFVRPYLTGSYMSYWVGWKNYMVEVLGVKITVDTSIMDDQLEFGFIYPFNDVCIFVERMQECHMKDGRLHRDGGPAITFLDDTRIYSLNGVTVPQWLAELPVGKISATQYSTLTNAEVRREFLRKVGAERLCHELGATTLDKLAYSGASPVWKKWLIKVFGDYVVSNPDVYIYELVVLDLGGTTGKWPYLKMLNPSIRVWHMEAVPQTCKTVEEALAFRDGEKTYVQPDILT